MIAAVNTGDLLGGLDASQLQAILDGADTLPGSIQIRNNSREYYSRGVQATLYYQLQTGKLLHDLQFGLRYHEDEEDRLQRNDNYQQLGGALLLNQFGLEGNAGNQIEDAQAWAFFVQDRIETGNWVFTPGLRYEQIDLGRTRFNTSGDDPSSRDPANFRDQRSNDVDVWLPGVGTIYSLNESTRIVAGVHRGFASPGSSPGVDPEESTNYELGIRSDAERVTLEAMLFFNDYENLVGICTNSSGSDCEPGAAFNGDGVDIPGLELSLLAQLGEAGGWSFPLQLAYTWMDAEFQTDFNSDFFGEVRRGDPVPYIPDQQLWASLGMLRGPWSFYLSGNFQDSVCTQASCGRFERTDSASVFDVSAHYRLNDAWSLYAVIENLTDEEDVVAREPYGARAGKPRSTMFGARFSF